MSQPTSEHDFTSRYAEGATPWEIGTVQPAIEQWADLIRGHVLDAGCGTGETSFFFAARGCLVTGVDAEAAAIAEAERKKRSLIEGGAEVPVEFVQTDIRDLAALPGTFDSVVDCLTFHVFGDEDRIRYVSGLRQKLKPGGTLLVLVFSDQEPPGEGPRRISAYDLAKSFARGFRCVDLHAVPIRMRSQDQGKWSPGGPKGWLAQFERLSDDVIDPVKVDAPSIA